MDQKPDGCAVELAVDAIDLYYQHRVGPDVPIEDVAGGKGGGFKSCHVAHSAESTNGIVVILCRNR